MSESPTEPTNKRSLRRPRHSSSPKPRRSVSNRSVSADKRRSSSSNYSSSNNNNNDNDNDNANDKSHKSNNQRKGRRRRQHRSSSSASSGGRRDRYQSRSRSGDRRARRGARQHSRSPGDRGAGAPPRYSRYSRLKNEGADPCTCIGVFGLSKRTGEDTLWDRFERFGRIDNVRLIMDRNRRESLGYAFVDYKELDSAKRAMKEAHGMEVDGNTIRLDYSVGKRPLGAPPGGGKYGARSNNGHRDWRPRSRSRSRSRSSRSSYGDRRRKDSRKRRSRSRSSRGGSYRKSRRDRRSRSRSDRHHSHHKRRRASRSDSRHSSR